jgi:hypothetical protein
MLPIGSCVGSLVASSCGSCVISNRHLRPRLLLQAQNVQQASKCCSIATANLLTISAEAGSILTHFTERHCHSVPTMQLNSAYDLNYRLNRSGRYNAVHAPCLGAAAPTKPRPHHNLKRASHIVRVVTPEVVSYHALPLLRLMLLGSVDCHSVRTQFRTPSGTLGTTMCEMRLSSSMKLNITLLRFNRMVSSLSPPCERQHQLSSMTNYVNATSAAFAVVQGRRSLSRCQDSLHCLQQCLSTSMSCRLALLVLRGVPPHSPTHVAALAQVTDELVGDLRAFHAAGVLAPLTQSTCRDVACGAGALQVGTQCFVLW